MFSALIPIAKLLLISHKYSPIALTSDPALYAPKKPYSQSSIYIKINSELDITPTGFFKDQLPFFEIKLVALNFLIRNKETQNLFKKRFIKSRKYGGPNEVLTSKVNVFMSYNYAYNNPLMYPILW
ncbi:hypothetical protein PHYBLDRAFT_187664 [Phycomyces blakesleeanus NRRL 1555(-)]|uniref:Uncharacterized protein n=1 Tax=Phycomyces blakesleeanus (strain ATCC 8743b / DSM 1359 / FGSC 10004 / NBRC 33097 / NRRL 1555) TaxID=763407 RepID=A0A163DK21_PHYB8|nr:hypothetical protein PHYBLDRAFT_187664 [Phycomyces blakesleeanus NRRL 1555(-)]OAD71820.1 hypothetical protein PHYBLDRAFT_187664 [Phycomyces blakesleeanus NRRL 1555(-)]|eukprot:XP_018289860.1 hypothetical protein PHYBLDRAFT_187664 [Phycomyces blakesleeanus NRRL 1555(-)]